MSQCIDLQQRVSLLFGQAEAKLPKVRQPGLYSNMMRPREAESCAGVIMPGPVTLS